MQSLARCYDIKEYSFVDGLDKWDLLVNVKKKLDECYITYFLNDVASSNGIADNKIKKIKNNTKTIGMVFYMNGGYSDDTEHNHTIHIPYAINPVIYTKIINVFVSNFLGVGVRQIICGHEHGDQNGKCHLQVAVVFESKIRKNILPGRIVVSKNGVKVTELLFMQQSARSSFKLKEYCKKDGDYALLNPDLELNIIKNKKDEMDVFKTIVENKDILTKDEAYELLQHKSSRDYFVCNANVNKALDSLIVDKLPEFKWILPNYLNDFTVPAGSMRVSFWKIFYDWFSENCLKEKIRKTALCLYSKNRGLGKTMFVRSLVNDSRYILEYNNTFVNKNLKDEDQYKLLLLDDMKDISSYNEQTWRSLVASQKTTIRDAYCNEIYDLCLPCIITTNSIKLVTRFVKDNLFNTQVIVVEIDKYMGPPETYDPSLYEKKYYLSSLAMMSVADEEKEEQGKKDTIFKILNKLNH